MNKKKLIWQIPFLLLLVIGTVIILKQGQENINYQQIGRASCRERV